MYVDVHNINMAVSFIYGFVSVAFLLLTGFPGTHGYDTCFVLYPNGTNTTNQCYGDLICCDSDINDQVCCPDGGLTSMTIVIIVLTLIVVKICVITCCVFGYRRRRRGQIGRVIYNEQGKFYGGTGPNPPPYSVRPFPGETGSPPPYREK